jgi:hypothetical protein
MRSSNNGRRPDGRFKPERGKSLARKRPWLRFQRAGGVWIPPRNRDAGAIQGVHKIGGTPGGRTSPTFAWPMALSIWRRSWTGHQGKYCPGSCPSPPISTSSSMP